jgi:hypothetical protein
VGVWPISGRANTKKLARYVHLVDSESATARHSAKGRDFAAWLGVVPEEHSTEASKHCGRFLSEETTTSEGCSCKKPEPLCSTGLSSRLV